MLWLQYLTYPFRALCPIMLQYSFSNYSVFGLLFLFLMPCFFFYGFPPGCVWETDVPFPVSTLKLSGNGCLRSFYVCVFFLSMYMSSFFLCIYLLSFYVYVFFLSMYILSFYVCVFFLSMYMSSFFLCICLRSFYVYVLSTSIFWFCFYADLINLVYSGYHYVTQHMAI